jgi:cytochrome b subunit of formate dehydrogenase
MFETIAILVIVATIVGIIVHWFAFPASAECRQQGMLRGFVHVVSMLLIEQRASLLGALKKLCYLVSVLCFLVLAITGFYPLLVCGEHISGYPMMIHATFAPIFAICLAIIGLTWAGQFRFQRGDCPWLQGLLRRATNLHIPAEAAEAPCKCTATTQKITFWAIVVLALPLILSIVLSMLPLFGTHWQEVAMAAHRWTAVVFTVAVLIHTYLSVRVRMAD